MSVTGAAASIHDATNPRVDNSGDDGAGTPDDLSRSPEPTSPTPSPPGERPATRDQSRPVGLVAHASNQRRDMLVRHAKHAVEESKTALRASLTSHRRDVERQRALGDSSTVCFHTVRAQHA